jgi:hypothetical protein
MGEERLKPSDRLTEMVRDLARCSLDSELASAATALADAFDETVASLDRMFTAITEGGK